MKEASRKGFRYFPETRKEVITDSGAKKVGDGGWGVGGGGWGVGRVGAVESLEG